MTTTITSNAKIPSPDNTNDSFSEIELRSIHRNGRDIAFSTSPDNRSPPVLFFYPAGGNRRMIYSFRQIFSDLYFICVNRPGKGGTSPAEKGGPESHMTTAVHDAVTVLDELGIDKVSLMCMCAGAPFCMTFAARYPERTTGKLVGISCWVQAADCGYGETKTSFYLGTKLRPLVAPVAGLIFASVGSSLSSFPASVSLKALKKGLSLEECEVFDEKFKDTEQFTKMMKWMQQDRGGAGSDVSVLLSEHLVDYDAVSDSQNITLWHGTKDALVHYASVEWLVNEALPTAKLNTVPDGTHEGLNFLFHSAIVDSLKQELGQPIQQ